MYLVCVSSFKPLNSSALSSKKYDNFNLIPGKRLQGQNASVRIGLIELTEPFDTLNYRSFFKHTTGHFSF